MRKSVPEKVFLEVFVCFDEQVVHVLRQRGTLRGKTRVPANCTERHKKGAAIGKARH